jgi:hypothetical protein
MSNITNTCLYQACTNITNIQSQYMCINHVPNHQPIPYQASTVYHNKCINSIISYTMYHKISTMKCLNKVPKHVPISPTYASNHAPYHQPYTSNNMPIIHRPCTSNMCHITHDMPQPITITMCQYIQDMHQQ